MDLCLPFQPHLPLSFFVICTSAPYLHFCPWNSLLSVFALAFSSVWNNHSVLYWAASFPLMLLFPEVPPDILILYTLPGPFYLLLWFLLTCITDTPKSKILDFLLKCQTIIFKHLLIISTWMSHINLKLNIHDYSFSPKTFSPLSDLPSFPSQKSGRHHRFRFLCYKKVTVPW